MAKKVQVTDVSTGYQSNETINDNFKKLSDGFDNTISRDGSTPNQMEADLDLNSNDLLNVKDLEMTGNLIIDGEQILPGDTVTVPVVTEDTNGLMLAEDKVKLDKVDEQPYRQLNIMEAFFGFDDGTTNTEIFTGANRAPQGMTIVTEGSTDKLFVMQRVAGSTYAADERMRIVEFDLETDGSVVGNNQFSNEINVGHGQSFSAIEGSSPLVFYSQMPTDASHTGTDAGKGISRITWSGSSTDQTNVEGFQLFGYIGSGHRFESFHKATVGVSPDGEHLVCMANDSKDNVDDLGHYMFIYKLSEVLNAGDPLDVDPIVGPVAIHPPTGNDSATLQGVSPGKDRIAVMRGLTGAFEEKVLQFYDYAGNHIKDVSMDGPRGDYTLSDILDNSSLGVPQDFEPEDLTWFNNDLYVQFHDVWRDAGDIVTWNGFNWACVVSSSLGQTPNEGTDWVRTTKAATAGAWDATVTYNYGTNNTRKSKMYYKVSETTGDAREVPVDSGKKNKQPTSIHTGQSAVDLSYRYGRDFNILAYNEAVGEFYRAIYYVGGDSLRLYDHTEGSDNDSYVEIRSTFNDSREFMALRAKGASVQDGAWANLYGDGDSTYPGWLRMGGDGETLAIEHDPVEDVTKVHNPVLQPLYDSGWTAVASATAYDFTHNLATTFASHPFGPLTAVDYYVMMWFRDGSSRVFQYPAGYSNDITHRVGPSIYHKSDNVLQIAFGDDGVFTHDNTDISGTVVLETSGEFRVKIMVIK